MDETKFIKEFMALTACSEGLARSVYLYQDTLDSGDPPVANAAEPRSAATAPLAKAPDKEASDS